VRTKILDTLVEIPGDTASDAGSTPAASTKRNSGRGAYAARTTFDHLIYVGERSLQPWTEGGAVEHALR